MKNSKGVNNIYIYIYIYIYMITVLVSMMKVPSTCEKTLLTYKYNMLDTWRNGYRRWFPELLRRQSSEGCRFNPHCRRVIYRNTYHLYPVMANGIRTGDPRGFNKGRSSKFREGSRVRQTPEEGRRTYRPKRCGNNNKDEDNCPKNLNDKNKQASSQKFWQLI